MPQRKVNQHGRKPGRGIRPWLLIPKVLAVGIYFGTVVTATVLWFRGPTASPHGEQSAVESSGELGGEPGIQTGIQTGIQSGIEQTLAHIDLISFLFRFVIVPALLATMLFGILLLLQHPRVLSRMRWWRVKMVSLAIFIPSMHLFMSSALASLREATQSHASTAGIEGQLNVGFVVTLLCSGWFIYLGRHKPRLGQNIAKALKH